MSKDIQINDPAFADFSEYVEKALKGFNVPGMAVAIVKDDQVIHSMGYGYRDVEKGQKVDSETIFAIGSSSKAFTTLCLGILVDQGKLDWETPVREYMPDFKLFDPIATEKMTPKDLVCHRSGLPRHDLMWYNSPFSRKEIYDRMRYLEPNKDFRSTWQYQNLMFMTAGYLIEAVSGLTWEEFTQKYIFDKIGMSNSNFSVEDTKKKPNYSLPYEAKDDEVKALEFRNIDAIGPAGSINSSMVDMVNWLKLHLGEKFGEEEVISESQLNEMHIPAMAMPPGFFDEGEFKAELGDLNYGLGWFMQSYRGHKLIHHGGNIDGFSAFVSFMPQEKLGVVVLTNLNSNVSGMSVCFAAYDRLLGLGSIDWNERWHKLVEKRKEAAKQGEEKTESKKVQGTKPSHDLEAYTGNFTHPGYGSFTVTSKDDQLYGTFNSLAITLEHYHYDIFEAVLDEFELRLPVIFATDFQGNIASFTIPLEPQVKSIIFTRTADDSMREKAFLEKFAGKYEIDGKTAVVTLKGDDTLTLAVPAMPEFELVPYQGTEFYVKDMDMVRVEFKYDEAGEKVVSLDLTQPGAAFEAKKIA